jgi:drug/metabolite transporter (DMT)-like permease
MILLATPVAGVVGSAVVFGEVATPSLMIAMAMILGGISTGVLSGSNSAQT